jgi:hypothetical protein
MVADQQLDELLRLGAPGQGVLERVVSPARAAGVRLLVGVALGVDQEAVLEVVDAKLDRLRVAHRTEMAGHLEATAMHLLERGAELLAGDVLVGLEGGDAAVRPVGDRLPRIVRPAQLMHLEVRIAGAGAFEVRPGDVEVRSGHATAFDRLLEP